jgi:magnesium chelatase family protein
MASLESGEPSAVVRARVVTAREVARERFAHLPWSLNSEIPAGALRHKFRATKEGMVYLHNELEAERLSARGFHKALRVAWSIADLKGHTIPNIQDIELAYALREGGELFR